MLKKYILLVPAFLLAFAFLNTASAGNNAPFLGMNDPRKGVPTAELHLNEQVQMGEFSMQITALEQSDGRAAKGMGRIFVPLINNWLTVHFADISVDETGELLSGEVIAESAEADIPTFRSSEADVARYLQLADDPTELPIRLNTSLEATGMNLNGHDLVLTKLDRKSSCRERVCSTV